MSAMAIRFGGFEFDGAAAELRSQGKIIHLQPKLLQLLEYLIRERQRVVSHRELLDALWASETVVPAVVTTSIRGLRRALADESASYIRTVQRRGYRFVAKVEDLPTKNALGHRPVALARHSAFVARGQELSHCEHLVVDPDSQVQVLFVHGPPGIGKTSLLQEFAYRCQARDIPAACLDAEHLTPCPDTFCRAFQSALGQGGQGDAASEQTPRPLRLVLIDNYERIAPLDAWLRENFLPGLPGSVRLVLASRDRPGSTWRSDPAWRHALQEIEIGPLDRTESARLVRAREPAMSGAAVEACCAYGKGHPLTLALSAESLALRPNGSELEWRAEIVDALVERFTGASREPSQRRALEVASFVEELDEGFLRAMLEPESSEGLLDWLAAQSCVRRTAGGVSLHPVARDAVLGQLSLRAPDRFRLLVERGMKRLASELARATGSEAGLRWSRRLMSLARHHPAVRSVFCGEACEGLAVQRASGASSRAPAELVERHEGPEAAHVARRWLDRQPDGVWIVADQNPTPAGFVQLLLLGECDRDSASWDPVVQAIFRHVDDRGGLAPDEIITVHRFIVARDTYQAISPVMQRCHEVVNYTHHWCPTGHVRVAHSYNVYGQPDVWKPVAALADFKPLKGYDARLGHRIFGLSHHSFRDCPFEQWAARLMDRVATTWTSHSA